MQPQHRSKLIGGPWRGGKLIADVWNVGVETCLAEWPERYNRLHHASQRLKYRSYMIRPLI